METIKPYGYVIDSGYVGKANGRWMLFPTETEYEEYIKERRTDDSEGL